MLIRKKWRKMKVSRVGGKVVAGQGSPRYAENPGNKEKQGVSNRLCYGSTTALVGPQLSSAKQNRFLSQCKQRCHTTVLASSAFGHVWWVAGAHWLWLQASSRRGLCSCVSLIPCLPFRSLFAWAQCCTNTSAHHVPPDWLASGDLWARDKQLLATLPQLHRAFRLPPNQCSPLVPGLYGGWSGWKPGVKFIPLVTLRYSAVLHLCSKWQSKRAVNGVAPESTNEWQYTVMKRMNEGNCCNV